LAIQVKICGITRVEDALVAADAGADMIGLNFWSGTPRCVAVDRAIEVISAVRDRLKVVGLFVESNKDEIEATTSRTGIRAIQLHGVDRELVESLSGLEVIQAFRVGGKDDLQALDGFPADAYLLDARVEGMHGGTGRQLDWTLARDAESLGRILLAGGLTSENVGEAIRAARPWGVDTASGVEAEPGIKDADKVRCFVAEAREASKELGL
jgi:phosphoribosylanthranilate isomerase